MVKDVGEVDNVEGGRNTLGASKEADGAANEDDPLGALMDSWAGDREDLEDDEAHANVVVDVGISVEKRGQDNGSAAAQLKFSRTAKFENHAKGVDSAYANAFCEQPRLFSINSTPHKLSVHSIAANKEYLANQEAFLNQPGSGRALLTSPKRQQHHHHIANKKDIVVDSDDKTVMMMTMMIQNDQGPASPFKNDKQRHQADEINSKLQLEARLRMA